MDKTPGDGVVDKREAGDLRSVRLLGLLAHDLRSPLAAVMTNLGFVESAIAPTDLDAIDAISDARISCITLEQLIANLDVLAGEGTVVPPEQASLRVLAQSAVARAERLSSALGVTLQTVSVSGGECPDALLAPIPFGRALDNLLANSIQYSSDGRLIRISVERHGDRGAIAIMDQGTVVPPRFRDEVLTAEGQMLAKHRPECRYGRGLGLFCAELAARTAGASLEVGERDGASLFLLSAPLA